MRDIVDSCSEASYWCGRSDPATLNSASAALAERDRAFFDAAFSGMDVPPALRRLVERIVRSYGIRGQSDPAYLANLIALELGMGDGNGRFPGTTP